MAIGNKDKEKEIVDKSKDKEKEKEYDITEMTSARSTFMSTSMQQALALLGGASQASAVTRASHFIDSNKRPAVTQKAVSKILGKPKNTPEPI
jgi:uncharacterized protein YaaN involved in tellurite resistance